MLAIHNFNATHISVFGIGSPGVSHTFKTSSKNLGVTIGLILAKAQTACEMNEMTVMLVIYI